jgi:hypothetical protein
LIQPLRAIWFFRYLPAGGKTPFLSKKIPWLTGKNAGISLFLGIKKYRTYLHMALIPLDLLV